MTRTVVRCEPERKYREEVNVPGRQAFHAKREPNRACRSAILLWDRVPRLSHPRPYNALSRFFTLSRGCACEVQKGRAESRGPSRREATGLHRSQTLALP